MEKPVATVQAIQDQELRQIALSMASHAPRFGSDESKTSVQLAEDYYKFLKGES